MYRHTLTYSWEWGIGSRLEIAWGSGRFPVITAGCTPTHTGCLLQPLFSRTAAALHWGKGVLARGGLHTWRKQGARLHMTMLLNGTMATVSREREEAVCWRLPGALTSLVGQSQHVPKATPGDCWSFCLCPPLAEGGVGVEAGGEEGPCWESTLKGKETT